MNTPDRQLRNKPGPLRVLAFTLALGFVSQAAGSAPSSVRPVTVWETHELTFTSRQPWENPYLDVDFWVRVRGPDGLERKVYGFWDGGNTNDGTWSDPVELESGAQGELELPPFPAGGTAASDQDWAFRACRLK